MSTVHYSVATVTGHPENFSTAIGIYLSRFGSMEWSSEVDILNIGQRRDGKRQSCSIFWDLIMTLTVIGTSQILETISAAGRPPKSVRYRLFGFLQS